MQSAAVSVQCWKKVLIISLSFIAPFVAGSDFSDNSCTKCLSMLGVFWMRLRIRISALECAVGDELGKYSAALDVITAYVLRYSSWKFPELAICCVYIHKSPVRGGIKYIFLSFLRSSWIASFLKTESDVTLFIFLLPLVLFLQSS